MKSQEFKKLKIPDSPGVYFFKRAGEVLYIGKATFLNERIKSYFGSDLSAVRGEQIARMVEQADALEWKTTDTVLEAIILEANLIKKHKPEFNSLGKDDKSFNHVIITKEQFPRALILRGKDLAEIAQGKMVRKLTKRDIASTYGPFTSGGSLKEALRLVRKIFPFRDTCKPCYNKTSFKPTPRTPHPAPCSPCFNAQLSLCPGVCSGAISPKDYHRNIQHIKLFFEGKKKQIIKELLRDMKVFARQTEFEKANEVKRQLNAIQHIQDIALLKRTDNPLAGSDPANDLANTRGVRIEGYDIAHFGGRSTVGVMVVVQNGEAKKEGYRMFKIRESCAGSDTDALREVLERRFFHEDWPMPDIVVVDGGKAQKNLAEKIISKILAGSDPANGRVKDIMVVGVVKNEHHKPERYEGDMRKIMQYERAILLANSEAHRFALKYHRKLRRKEKLY